MAEQIRFPPRLRPSGQMKRNDRCWCSSGLKWKVCHRGRDELERVENVHQPVANLAKAFRSGTICHHPDAPNGCSGKVISSHTIQKNGPLRRISRLGHVLGFRVQGWTEEASLPKRVGLREASTYPGFCAAHDSQFFAPVEVETPELTSKNAALLAFRSLTYELHQKRKSLGAAEIVSKMDAGRPLAEQNFVQQLASDFLFATNLANDELESKWKLAKTELNSGNFNYLESFVLIFDRQLPFVSSFYVAPYEDFANSSLQGWHDRRVGYFSFSSINIGEASAIFVSWERGFGLETLVEQLRKMPAEDVATNLFRFALANSENVFVSPDWYEALDDDEKTDIAALFQHNQPGVAPRPVYKLPTHRIIEASVTRIEQPQPQASP